jgi:hypothetical protein
VLAANAFYTIGLTGSAIAAALALSPQRVSAIRHAQLSDEVKERAGRVLVRLDCTAANDELSTRSAA